MSIAVICVHPDDEILAFGPLLQSLKGKFVDVICCFSTTTTRSRQFVKCVKEMGFRPYVLTIPDKNDITFEECYKVIEDFFYTRYTDYEKIYTHDPINGDIGCHIHHKIVAKSIGKYFKYNNTLFLYSVGSGLLDIYSINNEQYEDMLISVIQKGTKAKDVQFLSSGDYYPWGYIDHQSLEEDNPGAELFESENPEETLEKFIFNPKSILTIDNDNH